MTTLLSKILFDSCDAFVDGNDASIVENDNLFTDVDEIELVFGTCAALENSVVDDSSYTEMATTNDCIEHPFPESSLISPNTL